MATRRWVGLAAGAAVAAGGAAAGGRAWGLGPAADRLQVTEAQVEVADVLRMLGAYAWRRKVVVPVGGPGRRLVVRPVAGADAAGSMYVAVPAGGGELDVTVVAHFNDPTVAQADKLHLTLSVRTAAGGGNVRVSQRNPFRGFDRVADGPAEVADDAVTLLTFEETATRTMGSITLTMVSAAD